MSYETIIQISSPSDERDPMRAINVKVRDDSARYGSQERSHLLGEISIAGVICYIELIEVFEDEDGLQVVADATFGDPLFWLHQIAGDNEPFETVEIDGRSYVICATNQGG
ncbi:MAG: hypothetical protein R3C70_07115 [Geminicoccaceae bacterium]